MSHRRSPFVHLLSVLAAVIALLGASRPARAASMSPGCSTSELVAAITASQANTEDDTISLSPGCVYTLTTATLGNGGGSNALPPISTADALTIHGNGATLTAARTTARIFQIDRATVAIDHLAIKGGNSAVLGGAIAVGVSASATLSIVDSTLDGNSGTVGGAIYVSKGALSIVRSDLSSNQASVGGAIDAEKSATVTIVNSTLSDDSASVGGALYTLGTATVTGTTIVRGSATVGGNVNVPSPGALSISDSIIALGSAAAGPDFSASGSVVDGGHNLVGNDSGGFFTSPTTLAGTASAPQDPQIGPLADNGGPTLTCAPLATSPVLEAGDDVAAATVLGGVDQRGVVRPNAFSDIGAFQTSPLAIIPATVTLPAGATFQFSGMNGFATYYSFALATSQSGGSITTGGLYTAGPNGGDDLVLLTARHMAATAAVHVIPAPAIPIDLEPLTPSTVPPGGSLAFTATGGVGALTFDLLANGSGASIDAGGNYRAGKRGGTTDIVRVTDDQGSFQLASVRIGPSVQVTPAVSTVGSNDTVSFTATGGAPSYHWSFVTNASGGAIDPDTGAYVAGTTKSVTDVVQAVDAFGNAGAARVVVRSGIAVTPAVSNVAPGTAVQLVAQGGAGGFTWSLAQNGSGGSVDAGTGAYVAGPHGSTVDVIEVRDADGHTAAAVVQVTAAAPASPPPPSDAGAPAAPDAQSGPPASDAGSDVGRDAEAATEPDAGASSTSSSDDSGSSGCAVSGTGAGGLDFAGLALAVVALARRSRRRR